MANLLCNESSGMAFVATSEILITWDGFSLHYNLQQTVSPCANVIKCSGALSLELTGMGFSSTTKAASGVWWQRAPFSDNCQSKL